MGTEKKIRIALIVSVCIFLLGGVILTLGQLISFLKPLSYALLAFGTVAAVFTFFAWIENV